MSSNVVVSGPDNKRAVVRTTPAMPLRDVLATAHADLRLSGPVDGWELRRTNARAGTAAAAALDLSLSIRFANLPAGAKLDVVRRSAAAVRSAAAATVRVALQLEDGGRTIAEFPVATRLWEILAATEARSSGTINLTRRIGHPKEKSSSLLDRMVASVQRDEYMIPAMLIANQEVATIALLRSTTLASLGVEGSVLIRVMFRFSGLTLADVEHEISAPLAPLAPSVTVVEAEAELAAAKAAAVAAKAASSVSAAPVAVAPPSAAAHLPSAASSAAAAAAAARAAQNSPATRRSTASPAARATPSPSTTAPSPQAAVVPAVPVASTEATQSTDAAEAHEPFDRQITLYYPPTESSATKIQLPDSFFELSSTEIKALLSSQKKRRAAASDAPLMTQAMRDRDAAARNRARKSKYPKTLVRVRLPDGYLLQAAFMSDEPVQELYELVRFALNPAMDTADPLLPFRLVMPIPKTRDLDPTHNFYTANLAPAATVHLLLPAHTAWPGFQASVVGPPTTLPDASAELLLTSTRGELDEETARMDVDPPAAAYDDVESERRERAAAAALARTRGSGGGDDAKAGRPKWFTIGTK